MENLHISKSSLQEWFHQMVKKEMHIFAPVHSGDKVDFKRVTSYDEVATDYVQTTQSAKRFAFPKTEVLFSYQKDGKEATLQEADIHAHNAMNHVSVLPFTGGPVILPAVIFRLRSCRIRVHWWKS